MVVRAVRKLRAGAAAMGYGRGRHLRAVPPLAKDEVHLAHAQPAAPPPSDPTKSKRSRNAFIMVLLVGLSLAVWWGAHEVHGTLSGRKTMMHPTKGVLHFEHTSFQANDDPALKLVIYTPV